MDNQQSTDLITNEAKHWNIHWGKQWTKTFSRHVTVHYDKDLFVMKSLVKASTFWALNKSHKSNIDRTLNKTFNMMW